MAEHCSRGRLGARDSDERVRDSCQNSQALRHANVVVVVDTNYSGVHNSEILLLYPEVVVRPCDHHADARLLSLVQLDCGHDLLQRHPGRGLFLLCLNNLLSGCHTQSARRSALWMGVGEAEAEI